MASFPVGCTKIRHILQHLVDFRSCGAACNRHAPGSASMKCSSYRVRRLQAGRGGARRTANAIDVPFFVDRDARFGTAAKHRGRPDDPCAYPDHPVAVAAGALGGREAGRTPQSGDVPAGA